MIEQLLNSAIAKYRDLSVARRSAQLFDQLFASAFGIGK